MKSFWKQEPLSALPLAGHASAATWASWLPAKGPSARRTVISAAEWDLLTVKSFSPVRQLLVCSAEGNGYWAEAVEPDATAALEPLDVPEAWARLRKTHLANRPTEPPGRGLPPLPALVPYERPRRDIGFRFVDQVAREAKSIAGIEAITANSYTVRSTISPPLQRAVEEALQEGLSRYERSAAAISGR